MMHFIVLHCIVLHFIVLHCIVNKAKYHLNSKWTDCKCPGRKSWYIYCIKLERKQSCSRKKKYNNDNNINDHIIYKENEI